METIVIIGGGASGIVSAISAKNSKNNVIIFERNTSCLKKLLMTGNGKCNYYNDEQTIDKYYSTNMDIVEKIVDDSNMKMVIDFFNKLGIIYKKKNGYYYPFSNQAITIKDALLYEALRVGVDIKCDCLVKNIERNGNGFDVFVNDSVFYCDKLIISAGSCAYPKTGSDGMGYTFLERFGHTIIKPLPALVPLISNFKYAKDWSGVRSDVILSLYEDNNFIMCEEGEIQLTDYGISGICSFNISHVITRGLDSGKKEEVFINFVPFIDNDVSLWLDKYCSDKNDKNIFQILECILNNKLVSVILKTCDISFDKKYSELSTLDKNNLVEKLFKFPLSIIDTKSFDAGQVCNGGVILSEINFNTFESLIVPNLFITGELLDINGVCGGYNLTIAWLSGLLAGRKAGGFSD